MVPFRMLRQSPLVSSSLQNCLRRKFCNKLKFLTAKIENRSCRNEFSNRNLKIQASRTTRETDSRKPTGHFMSVGSTDAQRLDDRRFITLFALMSFGARCKQSHQSPHMFLHLRTTVAFLDASRRFRLSMHVGHPSRRR
jgi:hypothetical protein